MHSKTFSKKKLFIFHNEKTIQHLEQQNNQSFYVENLILSNIDQTDQANQNTNHNHNPDLYHLLKEIKQQITQTTFIPTQIQKEEIEPSYQQDNSISSSIANILDFK